MLTRRAAFSLALLPLLKAYSGKRLMTICLSPGSIQVKANQLEAIQAAKDFGFESVEAFAGQLAAMSDAEIRELTAKMKADGVVWGQSGLPVEFRRDEAKFREDLAAFPKQAKALRVAGVTRVSTWIMPTHDELPYVQNLKQHAARLKEVAKICAGEGQRLGLEYVGPKTLWTSKRYPFVHSMAEMKDLIGAIGESNVGFVLDSWHWYTAGETLADLKTITNKDIVSVDLNDAPAGLTLEQQWDGKRELPLASGVIDAKGFLNTLHELGCDAPVRCEPFNSTLKTMSKEAILATVAASMKKAMGLVQVS